MLPTEYDAALNTLLRAHMRHADLRSRHALLPDLAAANHELYRARMRTYRMLRGSRQAPNRRLGTPSR